MPIKNHIFRGVKNGFPFVIPRVAEDGEAVELWDGFTRAGVDLPYSFGRPSKSTASQIAVVGPGTRYPVGLTLAEAVLLYWRIRDYKVEFTLSGTQITGSPYGSGEYVLPSGTGDAQTTMPDFGWANVPETEAFLGCNAYGIRGRTYAWKQGSGSEPVTGTAHYPEEEPPWDEEEFSGGVGAAVNAWKGDAPPSVYYREADGLYYPFIEVTGGLGFYSGLASCYSHAWNDDEEMVEEPGVTCTIFGHEVPVYRYADTDYGDGYTVTTTWAGTIAVTAGRYWTYGGTYDETTGEVVA